MTLFPADGLEGQAHLSELLGEVSHALTAHGDVADHPLMKSAFLNGERFLVDTAVMTADAASRDLLPASEFESLALESVKLMLMAVVARRMRDADGVAHEDDITPPSFDQGANQEHALDAVTYMLQGAVAGLPPGAYEFRKVA